MERNLVFDVTFAANYEVEESGLAGSGECLI
jgi:hypothetical protein